MPFCTTAAAHRGISASGAFWPYHVSSTAKHDAVIARGAPRRGAHDVDTQLSKEVERALHELIQRPLEPRFAARLHRARDGDSDRLGRAHSSVRFLWHDLRLLRRLRRVMHHSVGVFDAAAVRASLLFEQSHERVVVLAVFPIALPL